MISINASNIMAIEMTKRLFLKYKEETKRIHGDCDNVEDIV